MLDIKVTLLFGFCAGVFAINLYNNYNLLYFTILAYAAYSLYEKRIEAWLTDTFLLLKKQPEPPRTEHDKRRNYSYPDPVPNTWYCLCDSNDLPAGTVKEVRALGQTMVLWRTNDGKPVCQDAFCIHIGANIGVGGWVENNCLTCPFHHWKFDENGNVKEIPYKDEPHNCSSVKQKLKTYECVDWCGLVFVWFHAEGQPPEYPLPTFIPEELERDKWTPHLKWDLGFFTLTPTDWVDQSSDWAHFNTLHGNFLIPWTTRPIPAWLQWLFPLGIHHTLKTYLGDDKEWQQIVKETGYGEINKSYLFFTDRAGITWKGKPVDSSMAQTLETFIGPAMMVFHIPFTIGAFKVFVATTPCEGGSRMLVRTWIDNRTRSSFWKTCIAWVLTGISASQLYSDIDIMCNKIRLKKPLLVKNDGPFHKVNNWINQFYSENSSKVTTAPYNKDW